jgi:uncharacterized protein YecE (DUF72 family)
MYDHWRGVFYPADVAKKKWLEYYAAAFATLEMNNTFYGMPRAHVCQSWRERTGEDFLFVLKLNRQITHRLKLLHFERPLGLFLEAAAALEEKLGPILVQLPPRFTPDLNRLEQFLIGCPASQKWAFEFRDPAWLTKEVFDLLARHNAALVIHDLIENHPEEVTADWIYFRFHGPRGGKYAGNYPPAALKAAAGRVRAHLKAGRDVYAYFNNDLAGHAVKNALDLRRFVDMRK